MLKQIHSSSKQNCKHKIESLLELGKIILDKADNDAINQLYNDTDLKDWKLFEIII